ncbi:MAG: hypothetical protein R3C18_19730 [Planctomycetaceae bacterium]
MYSRRQFLRSAAATAVTAPFATSLFANDTPTRRPRIAFLGTVVKELSHAQHFLDRMTAGYTWGGTWQTPRVEVAGVYVDQMQAGPDLGKQRIKKHGLKQFPSVAETLTLGGEKLAVDGVVIIGEHGDYPRNEFGQKLYPRYEWFKEAVKIFEASGRCVPIFNDKHLSTSWAECEEMVADSKRLDFPFLAGSSLPVTWRHPETEVPLGTNLTESVCVAYGGVDSYDFHALETAQCMSERRRGGEVGIRRVTALEGADVWDHLGKSDARRTHDLVMAALNRSHTHPTSGGFPKEPVSLEWAKDQLKEVTAYFVEHLDGFKTTILLTEIRDFNYAGYDADSDNIISCQMYLPMPGRGATTADFFNPLTRHIEEMMLTSKAAYPVERTLLTSGMVIGGVMALHTGKPFETNDMAVVYQAPKASLFWQA